MALTRNQKIGIGVGVGVAAALAFASSANADDTTPDDGPVEPPQCPVGTIPQLQPNGTFLCVPIEVIDADVVDVDDDDDDPLPPPPPQCNYSGCGPLFDNAHQTPAYYALRVQQLGYPINAAGVAANGSFLAVGPQREVVREFQRDYNAVRESNGAAAPVAAGSQAAKNAYNAIKQGPKLADDGLVGNQTIAAISRAHSLANALPLSWENIVNLSV